jgi:ADP-ribosylglycohydrolase
MDTNKAEGIIYGLAIGDALGRLTEFKSLPKIKSEHGKKGISDLPEPALFI